MGKGSAMNSHGNDLVVAIGFLQLMDDIGSGRTVNAALSGEVLNEYGACHVGRLHVNEAFVFVDMGASCPHDCYECKNKYLFHIHCSNIGTPH